LKRVVNPVEVPGRKIPLTDGKVRNVRQVAQLVLFWHPDGKATLAAQRCG